MMNENGRGGDRPNFPRRNNKNGSAGQHNAPSGGHSEQRDFYDRKGKNKNKRNGHFSKQNENPSFSRQNGGTPRERAKFDKAKGGWLERPRWTPVPMSCEEIPAPLCPVCGKPIDELSSAFSDKNSGEAVHFECARESACQSAALTPGDTVAYIGAGRFAIINYPYAQNYKRAVIKQIIEWEKREERTPWRRLVADHFSLT